MNTRMLIAGLAFGFVSANALAVEAKPFKIPITTLDRAEVRAQIDRSAAGIDTHEGYGSFTYKQLHGLRMLTREAVIAEMALPKWQAFMAMNSDRYNGFSHRVDALGTNLASVASATMVAAGGGAHDYIGG